MPPYKSITIITAPYHAGEKHQRVGRGPQALLDAGLVNSLSTRLPETVKIDVVEIEEVRNVPTQIEGDIGRSFAVLRHTSEAVRRAVEKGSWPLVLSGNCMGVVGVNAGLNPTNDDDVGGAGHVAAREREVIWFDAHADLESPDTTWSGYLDGEGGCMLMGECFGLLLSGIPGFRKIEGRKLVGVGFRDVSRFEEDRIARTGVRTVRGGKTVDQGKYARDLRSVLKESEGDQKRDAVLHFDVDVLDVSLGRANEFAIEGGLGEEDALECVDVVGRMMMVKAMSVASLNPQFEGWEKVVEVATKVIVRAVEHVFKTETG